MLAPHIYALSGWMRYGWVEDYSCPLRSMTKTMVLNGAESLQLHISRKVLPRALSPKLESTRAMAPVIQRSMKNCRRHLDAATGKQLKRFAGIRMNPMIPVGFDPSLFVRRNR